ncbi:MAG: phosphatidate cytidylyltransferase [Chlorobi bacterium]|nr:phosphatidate cytidylyltransferase [Chlorobiota bacterium]
MNNFVTRSLTGIFIVLAVVLSIWTHPYIYMAMFTLSAVLLMVELEDMLCEEKNRVLLINSVLLGTGIFILSFLHFHTGLDRKWMMLTILPIWAFFITVLFNKYKNPFRLVAVYLLISVYISLPFLSLNLLAYSGGDYNPKLLLAFFAMIWVNDTGAYIVGVNFGKHRLFERVSPKKSWEGFWGGLILTMIVAYFMSELTEQGTILLWLVTGLFVSVFATLGDLVESLLKRSVNIKDSGKLLPGHGGILDRFDGALFAAPVMSLLFYLFGS